MSVRLMIYEFDGVDFLAQVRMRLQSQDSGETSDSTPKTPLTPGSVGGRSGGAGGRGPSEEVMMINFQALCQRSRSHRNTGPVASRALVSDSNRSPVRRRRVVIFSVLNSLVSKFFVNFLFLLLFILASYGVF